MNHTTFSALGLPEPLLAAVEQLGYEEPSHIQAASIPLALEGKDLIGLSETGSGKTAAFGLAGLARIDWENPDPQMLVICPTRELAVQVCAEVQRLGAKLPRLRAVAVYGGAPIDRQIRALHQGVQVIVGTPGRLIDHVERGTLELDSIRVTVLDEADRMLDMGFADEMEALLRALPEERQTLFFSATMNDAVSRIIQRYGKNPELVKIEREALTVESIEQVCYEARQRSRIELISRLIDLEQPRLSIVFCNTKRAVDECTEELLARGYSADRLHGDIAQTMRERVLRLFREGTVEILVATDVAARGIDISDIDLVFNYELPQDPEDYVHRIGRTGRAGRSGKAISFIHGRDIYRIKTIERYTRQPIVRAEIPSVAEVENRLAEQLIETVRERLAEGGYEKGVTALSPLQEEGHEWQAIAGVLMALLRETTSREGEEIIEDRQPGPNDRKERRRERDDREPGAEAPSWEPHEAGAGRERRFERKPRPEGPEGPEPGMVKLFLSLGKNQHIAPGDIVGMLHNECHLERGTVGRIQLFPNFSLVEVAEGEASRVIELAAGTTLRGKSFRIDYDRGPKDGPPREGGFRSGGPREGGYREGGFRKEGGGYRKPGGFGNQSWEDRGPRGFRGGDRERRGNDRFDDRRGGEKRHWRGDRDDRRRRDDRD
ncbi:MAG: DEAD/DEAH box helicase [Verrucomicrobiae bacterium]|nr:DEAD/DEAH box helicase [Verrucomicrobiae bacterium]